MAKWYEHFAARIGFLHARRVSRRFLDCLRDTPAAQERALHRALALVTPSAFGRKHGLDRVRNRANLRAALPLATYEDFRPYIDRVAAGDTDALFAPRQRIEMFATSSGTTAKRKLVPVTPEFVDDYRRGWNTFGLKMLIDHPAAVLRAILQSSGRYDEGLTASGIPYGAITGLMARTQKRIVRRFYVGHPKIPYIDDPVSRYYALMRFAAIRDVAFAITANPATLIRLGETANEHSERLIRDIHNGTMSADAVPNDQLRRDLSAGLRPNPLRAAELQQLRRDHGRLRPRDMWNITFLACWTGGSLGHYCERLADWWGAVPVRDIGLLASEGRVSIPFEDGTPSGVIDVTAGCFEFIPAAEAEADNPQTLWPEELEVGQCYAVVLTNTTGLIRYRLDDVVRVTGWLEGAPLVEFLHRAGRVASIAGEKLTENQLVAAVRKACQELNVREFDFVAAPVWSEPPHYRLNCASDVEARLAVAVDAALQEQNEEYASRRKSARLGELRTRRIDPADLHAMDRRLTAARGSTAEQYKRPCLFTQPSDDDRLLRVEQ
ncbi:MAG: GH3 auxin-responsive promoter family protein [Phycisphaerae bacterium]|nr:GH3 auxin-responsive promoter family protein [Phycisphaerae bacterium]